jgi:uncharacterized membrane protein YeaQ/YmgE (transglycosylase-associated protein family)
MKVHHSEDTNARSDKNRIGAADIAAHMEIYAGQKGNVGGNMDWGFIVQMILGIVGAGMIVGGFVAYRGSNKTGLKAFSAAAVASGIVMWAIVAATLPVSFETGGGARDPEVHTTSTYERGS